MFSCSDSILFAIQNKLLKPIFTLLGSLFHLRYSIWNMAYALQSFYKIANQELNVLSRKFTMERKTTELNAQPTTSSVGAWKFILGFFIYLYKTAIRP